MKKDGAVAQLVEQRTENPCVPGSSPGGATKALNESWGLFLYLNWNIAQLGDILTTKKYNL